MKNQQNIREDLIKHIEGKYEIEEIFAWKSDHSHVLNVSFLPKNQKDLLKMEEDVNQIFGRNHKSNSYGNVWVNAEISDYDICKPYLNKKKIICFTQWR